MISGISLEAKCFRISMATRKLFNLLELTMS
jgi:hypothetical protein